MPDQPTHPARHLALAVVVALALLALGATPALAQPLRCGAVVTQDTTLAADLLDCPGNGLIVGADGITIDLGGHTISGQIIPGAPARSGSATGATTTSPSGTAPSGSSTGAGSTWPGPTGTGSRT